MYSISKLNFFFIKSLKLSSLITKTSFYSAMFIKFSFFEYKANFLSFPVPSGKITIPLTFYSDFSGSVPNLIVISKD